MYGLSRMMLVMVAGLTAYTILLVAYMAGAVGAIIVVALVVVILKRKGRIFTAFGTAQWSGEAELRRVGMIGAKQGLILGRLEVAPGANFAGRLKTLLNARMKARDACEQFLAPVKRKPRDYPLVRLPNAVHTAVFAPTGVGKGVSCVIPFLLTCEESCVVVDFKGDLATITAKARRHMGHEIVILDPFKVVAKLKFKSATFNPLDFISKDSPLAIDDCNALAQALVVRTGEEKEPHWLDSAEAWIAAITATVVQYGQQDKETRSLQTVREMLSNPQKLDMAIKLMNESDAWGGMLARMGGQLMHFVDKEKSSALTTVGRFLRFLDTLAIAENTRSSSFDPVRLRKGRMTVYLVLPPEHMIQPLIRMWIGSMLQAVVRGGLQERNKVHFVLDEAASLGAGMEALNDAVDKYRAFGVRLIFAYQSLGQLKKCWPQGQDQTLLSNTTQVFFGVNDQQTAEYVSARLGEETIVVDSGGTSRGTSRQFSDMGTNPHGSTTYSSNSNSNWQQHGRKLLKPEEVLALPPRIAITFTPGVLPVWTTLVRYFEEKNLFKPRGWLHELRAACRTFIGSAVLLVITAVAAVALTKAAAEKIQRDQQAQPWQYAVPPQGWSP